MQTGSSQHLAGQALKKRLAYKKKERFPHGTVIERVEGAEAAPKKKNTKPPTDHEGEDPEEEIEEDEGPFMQFEISVSDAEKIVDLIMEDDDFDHLTLVMLKEIRTVKKEASA